VAGKSSNFWDVVLLDGEATFVVRWGAHRRGGAGEAEGRELARPEAWELATLVAAKRAKGYVEASGAIAAPRADEASAVGTPELLYLNVVEALGEPGRVHPLELSPPSAIEAVPPEALAAIARIVALTRLETLPISSVDATLPPLGELTHLRVLQLNGVDLARLLVALADASSLRSLTRSGFEPRALSEERGSRGSSSAPKPAQFAWCVTPRRCCPGSSMRRPPRWGWRRRLGILPDVTKFPRRWRRKSASDASRSRATRRTCPRSRRPTTPSRLAQTTSVATISAKTMPAAARSAEAISGGRA
jgi:predicted DNA-binding WGR domain protein